jgi:hypothetical protein
MKVCTTCNIEKPLDLFYKQKNRKKSVMSQCKSCSNKKQKERREYLTKIVKRYKLLKGCEFCGYRDHFSALHLDHLDPSKKFKALSRMQTYSKSRIKEEIIKCRVLCANCHAVYTFYQQK